MSFYFDPFVMGEMATVAFPVIASVLTSALPSMLLGIASYVLSSLALYTLATRRQISKAWLSWVPVVNVWIVGSLSDQYRYVVKGQFKSKRKVLLILNLINAVLALTLLVVAAFSAADVVHSTMYGMVQRELMSSLLGSVLSAAGLAVAMSGIALAVAVIRYMALYDIYTSMDPANSVLFTVLSIIFRVTEPFFLFFNRNKDEGMPPRKPEAQQIPQEAVFETWEEEETCL